MFDLYTHIEALGKAAGYPNIQQLCAAAGVPRAIMTELHKGRAKSLSEKTAAKFCAVLGVSMDVLYGRTAEPAKRVTDEDIKFALFGGDSEITDEMYEEVKKFAEFVKHKAERK